jgi:hypothetical protein
MVMAVVTSIEDLKLSIRGVQLNELRNCHDLGAEFAAEPFFDGAPGFERETQQLLRVSKSEASEQHSH